MTEPALLLACGRDPIEVADHAANGSLDTHERGCPHCQAVVTEAAASRRLAGTLAADVEPAPPSLVPGVMRTVRTELRNAELIPVPSPHGPAFVSDHVMATCLRWELDRVDGLAVSSCRVLVDAGDLTVRITALGEYPADLVLAASRARRAVLDVVPRQFGLTPGAVDVEIVDLALPGDVLANTG